MATQGSGVRVVRASSGRLQCWVESLVLGLGIPAAIWVVSKLISTSFPAAVHGSPEQRYLFWLSAGVIVEWLFVIGLWFASRRRGLSFGDFGVWRLGTWLGWVVALLFAALSLSAASSVSASNAHSNLIRVLTACWISPHCCSPSRSHGGILRRSSVSRLSND